MAMLLVVLTLVITSIVNRADDDVSCHYTTEGDALPSAEDASFSLPTDSIFFHEASCRGVLNSRQACAVESAAKAHPAKKIYVLFSGRLTLNELYFNRSVLLELKNYYPNINFRRVHISEYAKNTALENIVTNKTHHKSQWQVVHTSDLLRLLTIYKFGGLYLDMDMIVVKPLDDLGRNWVAIEGDQQVGNAVVNAAKDDLGQEFMAKVLEEVGSTYRPDSWDHNGPKALLRVLSNFCNTTKILEFSKANCQGFEVYNPEKFYLMPYSGIHQIVEPGDLKYGEETYTIHLWNSVTHDMVFQLNSPLDKLAKRHCPIMRKLYGDCFGQ